MTLEDRFEDFLDAAVRDLRAYVPQIDANKKPADSIQAVAEMAAHHAAVALCDRMDEADDTVGRIAEWNREENYWTRQYLVCRLMAADVAITLPLGPNGMNI